jgi:hypothetical protein
MGSEAIGANGEVELFDAKLSARLWVEDIGRVGLHHHADQRQTAMTRF